MTDTSETPQCWQPGMRRRKVDVERPETTVIDGRPSTRMVKEKAWVALPPRDWDEVIRRGATGVAIVVTLLAAAGTTASVGGLLGRILHPYVAYAVGAVFTSSWLVCIGIEHIERVDADRAARARNAGWVMLLIGMGAVITYGYEMQQLPAGVVGSCLDLTAKGLWWLIMGLDRVKLAPGVAHWVAEGEQEMAGQFLLGTRLGRLNRRRAQLQAAGGPEFQAAAAILAQAAAQAQQIPAADVSGQGPAQPPVPPVPPPSGQGPGVSGQPPAPAPAATPRPTAPVPPAAPLPPTAPVGAPNGQQTPPPAPPNGGAHPIGESIAATVRKLLKGNPAWAVDESLDELELRAMTDAVRQVHGERPRLQDTVRRTRDRELKNRRKTA